MATESARARLRRVVAAWALTALVRLVLSLCSWPTVQVLADRAARMPLRLPPEAPWRTAARVTRVARGVPGATCLTQALATRVLLAWHGQAGAVIRFGVRHDGGALVAHAWVEHEGRVVIGGPDVGAYVPLDGPSATHAR
jgi:hypothetical protein